jgi:phosphinothricin acetyltransferase
VATGAATFELVRPTVEEMARRHAEITEAGYPFFVVASPAQEVVGYAYASAYRARPAYRFTVEDSIYLSPAAAGRGLGGRLLAALIDACTARGDRQMIAVIGGADNAASIAVHARAGFVEAGRLSAVGRKFERWVDTVLMQRPLGEGATSPPPPR